MYIWSVIGVLLVLWITIRFFKEIGKSFPVLELLLLIAGMQWVLGAFNAYRLSVEHFKYYMRVDETTYMSYVVPAFLGFVIIILVRTRNSKIVLQVNVKQYTQIGRYILLIGVIADFLKFFVPSSLLFFFYLLSLFKFVGVGILLFSRKREDRIFFYLAIAYLLIRSLNSAMFHDFILWGVFLFLLWALKNKPTFKLKITIILSGIIMIVAIQMVKQTFREAIWSGYSGNKISLFLNVLDNNWSDSYFSNEDNLSELNVRLNQGWIIAAIINHVPNSEPYANGGTVVEALEATLLPRFLSPNKKIAGGKVNYEKYTGLLLGKNTSMGLSIIGEAYANFGAFGGVTFMLFWGWFLSSYWNKIHRYIRKHPLLLFFIPLLFLQVVKAETELMVVLNHLIKASLVVWLFFWFSNKYLNWRI